MVRDVPQERSRNSRAALSLFIASALYRDRGRFAVQNPCTWAPFGGSNRKSESASPWLTFGSEKTIWLTSLCGLVTTLARTWPSFATTKTSFCTPGVGLRGVSWRPSPTGSPAGGGTAFGENSLRRSPFPQRKEKALLS